MKKILIFILSFFACISAAPQTNNFAILDHTSVVNINESYSITQTAVTMTGSSLQLIAANANRKYLAWMVIGTADVTCVAGAGP